MDVRPFRIERYYARYEFTTRYMLSSSDCESRTIESLLGLEPGAHASLLSTRCGYTESPGAPELRAAIAGLYERIDPDEVIVTSCAEEGIFLLYHALLRVGDHAIVEAPCYESALELSRSTGAEVSPWQRRYEHGWAHDLGTLERLVRPATRVLYVNQPHNPTGTLMDRGTFERVVELAQAHGIVLFSDEVYRELEHDPGSRLPAACDLDERAVSLGSISKSYGLPGLRLGWLVTRDADLRETIMRLKDYTTICSSAPSEVLTAVALRQPQRPARAQPRHRAPEPDGARGVICAPWRDLRLGSPRRRPGRLSAGARCPRYRAVVRAARGSRRPAAARFGLRRARARAGRIRAREPPRSARRAGVSACGAGAGVSEGPC
jgi:hypothetical protein